MRARDRQAVVAVVVLVVLLGIGAAASGADTPTLTIDQRKSTQQLDAVVDQVHDACEGHPDEDLTVRIQEPTEQFSVDVVCSAALADIDGFIRQPLLEEAARHRNAGPRARAVIDLREGLPPTRGLGYDYDSMVWGIASSNGNACRRAASQKQIREGMSIAAQGNQETPETWTLIEAVFLAGVCPDKLPALYRNVAALGNPIAANTVKELVERKPVTLPLGSVPRGISQRSVNNRPVFLNRERNRVTTFLTDVHHLPGETTLWWCPNEKVFVSPAHAETFDAHGAKLEGPAQRGLDRFKTTTDDGTVTVHLSDIIHGTTQQLTRPVVAGAQNSGVPWDTSPDSFCFGAVKAS